MTDVIIPNTAPVPTRFEVRCTAMVSSNNLGINVLPGKYGMQIQRVKEPQDAMGVQVGERIPLPDVNLDVFDIIGETHVLQDGTKLTVGQILEAVNAVIDAHKGAGIA